MTTRNELDTLRNILRHWYISEAGNVCDRYATDLYSDVQPKADRDRFIEQASGDALNVLHRFVHNE
jgi:hypothetical protein